MSRSIRPKQTKPKYITVLIGYGYDDIAKCLSIIESIENENDGYKFVQFGRDVCAGPFAIMRYEPRDTTNLIRG